MKNSKLNFLKDNKQVIYSIILMIVVPGVLIFNTWLFSGYYQEIANMSLQNKAIGIGQAFNAGVNESDDFQMFINKWGEINEDTKDLEILLFEEGSFRRIASMNNYDDVGRVENNYNYLLSWNANNPVAQKIFKDGKAYWSVVMPLKDDQGNNFALLSMNLSADVISTKLVTILAKSYWVLLLSVVLIVLLLLVNSRLFEYSILYNKIKEVDKMKDEFISMASHELRTPVTVIKGYAQTMMEESKELNLKKEGVEYLSIINTSTERLGNLIEDLLNVSRIEQGRFKVELKEINAQTIIEETIKEISVQAKEKNLILNFEAKENMIDLISADKDKLKQVLINIIGNSIKYTNEGSVDVKIYNKDNNLIINIKDTGIGMSAKEREHLFEKFYRIKNKRTQDVIGTGLGLWITKQIIEIMKGNIFVDSIEEVGTQVTIEFPLIIKKDE
ncbi:MAG: HAMP domain-containing sensor histidine kinase [Candidatus Pacebacteria bacterium]|nr:HAMP domain-containing sensor histidine kinase [Candidatus Paceibacterota bacterium]MDD2757047.1 HAMP domain-containing sensor histidine kinase [Candidatus Paceibacterota bacterium]MDD3283555.1 HAMP domain-containing sensor histidine kinase [Candidatus Paceibacterota bacterium]MDD3969587.1 HAMP domain-containing sensor histidine kinase [Candidatus Paceibacterota bacterium]MDD4737867.1 HAMP domain-containing sensor histidine kinase [Candidatus Paceibacterota bacterium]